MRFGADTQGRSLVCSLIINNNNGVLCVRTSIDKRLFITNKFCFEMALITMYIHVLTVTNIKRLCVKCLLVVPKFNSSLIYIINLLLFMIHYIYIYPAFKYASTFLVFFIIFFSNSVFSMFCLTRFERLKIEKSLHFILTGK